MVRLLSRDDRGICGQREVDTGIWHQVGLELGQINIEGTIETKGSSDGGHNLTDQPVQVGVGRTLDIEVPTADIVDGLVIYHEGAVRVLQGGVGGQDGVVGLHHSGGHLGSWVDGELQLGLLAVVDRQTNPCKNSTASYIVSSLCLPLSVHGPVGLVHVDAHADTSDVVLGEKIGHGTPFRRCVEEGLLDCRRVVQIGLRGSGYSPDSYEWRQGFHVVQAEDCWFKSLAPLMAEVRTQMGKGPIYLSFVINALDPSFAPGTPEIAGLTAIQIIRGCHGLNLVGCDLVEVSPPYDPQVLDTCNF
uniref:Agmatinase (putative) n=1 Tax=Seriola dumerili TaxID=41447 RepID=A0A3B4TGK1_SERDU